MAEFLFWSTVFQSILYSRVTKHRRANSDSSNHENEWGENFKQLIASPSAHWDSVRSWLSMLPIPYLSAIALHFAGHKEDEIWRVIWDIKDLFLSNKAAAITEFSWSLEEKD